MNDKLDAFEYGKILSGLWLLERLRETTKLKQFLTQSGKNPEEGIFPGFQFLVELLVRTVYNGIEMSIDDFELFRKIHFGEAKKTISDFTEKNPDLRLLKEINRRRRDILQASDWNKFESELKRFVSDIETKLNAKIKKNVKFSDEFSMEEIKNFVSIFWLHLVGHDIRLHGTLFDDEEQPKTARFGEPQHWWTYTLDNRIQADRLASVVKGYAAALTYLWSELLPPSMFRDSGLQNLINANSWGEIDGYFHKITDTVISNTRSEIGFDLDRCVFLQRRVTRRKEKPVSIERINSKKQAKNIFLNYRVEVIRHWGAGDVFRGAGLFLPLLTGCSFHYNDKVIVLKFIHPQKNVKGSNYSYGILVQAGGLWDYSGWILLYNCCGDYSGFSGSQHAWIERSIKSLRKRIELKEFIIRQELLESVFKDLDPKERQLNDYMILSRDVKGLILELLSVYSFAKKKPRFVKWSFSDSEILPSNKEIDLLAVIENVLYLIEVEFSFNTKMEDFARELNLKEKYLESKRELFSEKYAHFDEIKKIVFFAIRDPKLYNDLLRPGLLHKEIRNLLSNFRLARRAIFQTTFKCSRSGSSPNCNKTLSTSSLSPCF